MLKLYDLWKCLYFMDVFHFSISWQLCSTQSDSNCTSVKNTRSFFCIISRLSRHLAPRRSTSSSARLPLSCQISSSLTLSLSVCVCACVCRTLTDRYLDTYRHIDRTTTLSLISVFGFDVCFILKIGQILCAFSLCDFLSGTICSVQPDKVAHGKKRTLQIDHCRARGGCAAAAGSIVGQIRLHGCQMESGSAPRLFAALLHPVCFCRQGSHQISPPRSNHFPTFAREHFPLCSTQIFGCRLPPELSIQPTSLRLS